MTTKIPVELSSTPGIVDGSNATAITIDSSEKVGINEASPDLTLHVNSGATNAVAKFESTDSIAVAQFKDNNGEAEIGCVGNDIGFYPAGAEKMRLDSSGNMGIGTTTTTGNSGHTNIFLGGTSNIISETAASADASLSISQNAYIDSDGSWEYRVTDEATNYYQNAGNHVWRYAASGSAGADISWSEAMRITPAGDLYFAQTSGSVADVGTILQANGRNFFMASTTSEAIMHTYNNTSNSGAKYIISFRQNNTEVGSIEVGTSSTALVGSSDYRLKENVEYSWDATTRLKQLKPCRFNWIADETNTSIDGFLAHEVQDIVPEAVRGEKDAVYTAEEEANELGTEGEPKLQGIDQSKLIPLLVKTIQELEARIKTLEDA